MLFKDLVVRNGCEAAGKTRMLRTPGALRIQKLPGSVKILQNSPDTVDRKPSQPEPLEPLESSLPRSPLAVLSWDA